MKKELSADNRTSKRTSFPFFIRIIALALSFIIIFENSGIAQVAGQLDISGNIGSSFSSLSPVYSRQAHLRYISYDKINQSFKVILNKGNLKSGKDSVRDPLKFFYTGITLPDESFWVNLNPNSPDKVIDDYLAKTEAGRIMLEADLELKKDLARATHPSTPEGKEYWEKLYRKVGEIYGSGWQSPVFSVNTRIWITPGEVVLCEDETSVYIYKAALNVSTEESYLRSRHKSYAYKDDRAELLNNYSSGLMKELILPRIAKEVNTGAKYASLRQVYYSLILAQWFKRKFYGVGGLYPYLINKQNLAGITSEEEWSRGNYFKEYQRSYREKEYNLQAPVYGIFGRSVRTYASGGLDLSGVFTNNTGPVKVLNAAELHPPSTGQTVLFGVTPGSLEDPAGFSVTPISGQEEPELGQSLQETPPAVRHIGDDEIATAVRVNYKTRPYKAKKEAPSFWKAHISPLLLRLALGLVLLAAIFPNTGKSAPVPVGQRQTAQATSMLKPENMFNIENWLRKHPEYRPILEAEAKDINALLNRLGDFQYRDIEDSFSLGGILKAIVPLGDPTKLPSAQLEATVGNIPALIYQGGINMLAVSNERDPQKQAAAAYKIGSLAKEVKANGFFPWEITRGKVMRILEDEINKDGDQHGLLASEVWAYGEYLKVEGKLSLRGASVLERILNHQDWLVRANAAIALEKCGDADARKLLNSLFKREIDRKDAHACVLLAAQEALFRLGSPDISLLSEAIGRLGPEKGQGKELFALKMYTLKKFTQAMEEFGKASLNNRARTIAGFNNGVNKFMLRQDIADKYKEVNALYLPVFYRINRSFRITPAEIMDIQDEPVREAFLRALKPQSPSGQLSVPTDAQKSYQQAVVRYSERDPSGRSGIIKLKEQGDLTELIWITLYDHDSGRRALAADTLATGGDILSVDAFIGGLKDSDPVVRQASAKGLRQVLTHATFIYTGADDFIVKALTKACEDSDWAVLAYLADCLRMMGGSDAQAALSIMVTGRNQPDPVIQRVVIEALGSFTSAPRASIPAVKSVLGFSGERGSELETTIAAAGLAGKILGAVGDDQALADALIYSLIDYYGKKKAESTPLIYPDYIKLKDAVAAALKISGCAPERINIAKRENAGNISLIDQLDALSQAVNNKSSANNAASAKESGRAVKTPAASSRPAAQAGTPVSGNTTLAGSVQTGDSAVALDPSYGTGERIAALRRLSVAYSRTKDTQLTRQICNRIISEPGSAFTGEAIKAILAIGDGFNKSEPGNPIVDAFKAVALNKGGKYDYELQRSAISALGLVDHPQARSAIAEILTGAGQDNIGIVISASEAACSQIRSGSAELFLLQRLVDTVLDKFDIQPNTVSPEMNVTYNRIAETFKQRKAQVFIYLSALAKDNIQNQGKINHILFLAESVDAAGSRDLLSQVQKSGPNTPGASAAMPKDLQSLLLGIFKVKGFNMPQVAPQGRQVTQVLETFSLHLDGNPSVRAQALIDLIGENPKYFLHPNILNSICSSLNDPEESVRIAACFVFMNISQNFIYYSDYSKANIMVDSLTKGIADPHSSMSFEERLTRICALARIASPYSTISLLDSYYALGNLYPSGERLLTGEDERQRSVLSRAIQWGLSNIKGSSTEIKNKLISRLDTGSFILEDSELIFLLQKMDPAASRQIKTLQQVRAVSQTRTPESVIARYPVHESRGNWEIDTRILNEDASGHTASLERARQSGTEKMAKNEIAINTPAGAMRLLFDQDRDIRIAAAFYLGEKKEPASLGALITAFNLACPPDGRFASDRLFAAAILRALAQFENAGDLCLPVYLKAGQSALAGEFTIGRELAHCLAVSGTGRPAGIIQDLFTTGDPMTQVLAADSAYQLIIQNKAESLVYSQLKGAMDGYYFLGYRPSKGVEFNAAGLACFNNLSIMAQDPRFHSLLDEAVDALATYRIRDYVKSDSIHPVTVKLLKLYNPDKLKKMEEGHRQIRWRHWASGAFWAGVFLSATAAIWLFFKLRFRPLLHTNHQSRMSRMILWFKRRFPARRYRGFILINPGSGSQNTEREEEAILLQSPSGPRDADVAPGRGNGQATPVISDQDIKYLEGLEVVLDTRVPDQRLLYEILGVLQKHEPHTGEYERARDVARHIHPDDFKDLRRIAGTEEPFAGDPVLQKRINAIALERPSELQVALARSRAKINDWKDKLEGQLTESDIIEIADYCERISDIIQLPLTQETSDSIGGIDRTIREVYVLALKTLDRLPDPNGQGAQNLARYGHKFADYLGELMYLAELDIAKSHVRLSDGQGDGDGNGNGSADYAIRYALWQRLAAIPAMERNAKENLKILLPKLGNTSNIDEYYFRLQPTRIGSAHAWLSRKRSGIYLSFMLGTASIVLNRLVIINSFDTTTFFGFFLPNLMVIGLALAGFFSIPAYHFIYARKGWEETTQEIRQLHQGVDEILRRRSFGPGDYRDYTGIAGVLGNDQGFAYRQPVSTLADLERALKMRIDGPEVFRIIFNVLQTGRPHSREYELVRQIIRHAHPDDFKGLKRMAETREFFAGDPVLRKRIASISMERPSELHVGIVRAMNKIHDWEDSLKRPLTEAGIPEILGYCDRIADIIGIPLTQETSDSIGSLNRVIRRAYHLIHGTVKALIEQGITASPENEIKVREALIKGHGHKFADYLGELMYLADMDIAKGYVHSSDNGDDTGGANGDIKIRYSFWQKVTAIPAMERNAKANLDALLPKLGRNDDIDDYYLRLQPARIGSARAWLDRKRAAILFSAMLGLLLITFHFPGLWNSFDDPTFYGFFLPNLRRIGVTILGFILIPSYHFIYARKGWEETAEEIQRLHQHIDDLEEEWDNRRRPLEGPAQGPEVPPVPPAPALEPGGIDFMKIDPAIKKTQDLQPKNIRSVTGLSVGKDVDTEGTEIDRLLRSRIIPSPKRLEEYREKTGGAPGRGIYFGRLNNWVAESFVLEEEYYKPTDDSLIDFLRSVVSR